MKPIDSGVTAKKAVLDNAKAEVSFLEQALWKRLNEADEWDDTVQAWLVLQCRMIAGSKQGTVVLPATESGGLIPVARWPESETPSKTLAGAVELAFRENRGAVLGGSDSDGGGPAVAYPVTVNGSLLGVVAVGFGPDDGTDLRLVMRQLQWGAAWVRDLLRKREAEEQYRIQERTGTALELIATVLDREKFEDASRTAATEIAMRCGCERVSVGFLKRGHATVSAISHSAQYGKKMDLVRCLGAAMDEAIDQRCVILYPPLEDDGGIVFTANAELARSHRSDQILTVPLFVGDEYCAAFVFERAAKQPFDQHVVDLLECVAAALGPILDEKRRNDRWIFKKLADSVLQQATRLVGPSYFGRKIAVTTMALVMAFFYFAYDVYRVNADATIEGLTRRTVTSPFDGFVKQAEFRAGDKVHKGDVLAALDDQNLVLERLKWVTDRQQRQHEYERALASRERATVKIVSQQIAQADAQIKLIDEKLSRAKLIAPFDGVILSGDLSQSLGAAVSRGEVMFEVAPLDGYRVILKVDESQIADIQVGQRGRVLASSLPNESFPFTVEKITSIAESSGGRNFFRVEGRLTRDSDRLRPGMQGIGKIDIEDRRLIWIWTRTFMDWLRIQSWSWMP